MHKSSGTDNVLTLVPPVPSATATLRTDHAMHDGVAGDSDVGTGTKEDDMECKALGTEVDGGDNYDKYSEGLRVTGASCYRPDPTAHLTVNRAGGSCMTADGTETNEGDSELIRLASS